MSAAASNVQSEIQKAEPSYAYVKEEDKDKLAFWLKIKIEIDKVKSFSNRHEKKQEAIRLTVKLAECMDELLDLFITYPTIKKEYNTYGAEIKHLAQYINESDETLEKCTRAYFEKEFSQKNLKLLNIEFHRKKSGVQVGKIAVISYLNNADKTEQKRTYFIKTHQHGSASWATSIKSVDPKELFVYKVLEYMGFGPESHFYFNPLSMGGVYIATRDLSSSKCTKVQGDKHFNTYETFKEMLSPNDDIKYGVTCADIIARIFRLEDVTTNPTNFGFVSTKSKTKCKICDFRITTLDSYEYVDIFKGFLAGNGMFNYSGWMKSILKDRPESERLWTAQSVIQGLTHAKGKSIVEAINRAFLVVKGYLENHLTDLGLDKVAIEDLINYVNSVQTNLNKFTISLNHKITEISQPSQPHTIIGSSSSLIGQSNPHLIQYQQVLQQQNQQSIRSGQPTETIEKSIDLSGPYKNQ